MTRGYCCLLVAIAALALLAQGASSQTTQCSATKRCADATNCCSQHFYCDKGPAFCGTGCVNGPCTGRTAPAPPGGGPGWSRFLTKNYFERYFPQRDRFYTYEGFRAAASSFPAFGTSGGPDDQRRELAAFLAHVNHETGGLTKIEEGVKEQLCSEKHKAQYPCAPGKKYYGRGPLQLSWNYNYGAFDNDVPSITKLLAYPDQVSRNSKIAWQAALWFWMTQGPHDAIMGKSFSGTIRRINSIECGTQPGDERNTRMSNRVKYYLELCRAMRVDPGKNNQLYC